MPTSGDASNDRQEDELDGIVPCTEAQGHSIWLWLEVAVVSHVLERLLHLLRSRPRIQMVHGIDRVVTDQGSLHQRGFGGVLQV